MIFSDEQQYHISRLRDRLEGQAVIAAFEWLFDWAIRHPGLQILPLSRGAFSAIHLSTRHNPRPYADCEFGFKGAKHHLRWWFQKPGFSSGLFFEHEIENRFSIDRNLKATEMMFDIIDLEGAKGISAFVEDCVKKIT